MNARQQDIAAIVLQLADAIADRFAARMLAQLPANANGRNEWWSVTKVAERFGCSRRKVYSMLDQLEHTSISSKRGRRGQIRISAASVERLLAGES